MNAIRQAARDLRVRIESGDLLDLDEAIAACVTLEDALTVFSDVPREADTGFFPVCCGEEAETKGGWLGARSRCLRCSAEVRDALGPMSSPFLQRGNSFVSFPSEELAKRMGERHWIVMHEGDRP